MNVIVMYLRILERVQPDLPVPMSYQAGEERFLARYKQFKPQTPHRLLVVNCAPIPRLDKWDDVITDYAAYTGFGSDCGTYQHVGRELDCDLVVAFNTLAYPWRDGWLEPLVRCREQYGPGVYGPTASYEGHAHLRTPCIAFSPDAIKVYPYVTDTRDKAVQFESGPMNFSLWAYLSGMACRMVTPQGSYEMCDWRTPDNIFRRGDQSNTLVRDRHFDVYDAANPTEKRRLEYEADNL